MAGILGLKGGETWDYEVHSYTLARLMGDANAVKEGKVGKTITRCGAGKVTGRGLGKLFK